MAEWPTTVKEALTRAAEVIEQRGWRQGDSAEEVDGGPVCVVDAIKVAVTGRADSEDEPPLIEYALEVLADWLGIEGCDVEFWNDAAGRTADEVVAACRATAAAVRPAAEEVRCG